MNSSHIDNERAVRKFIKLVEERPSSTEAESFTLLDICLKSQHLKKDALNAG